MALTRSVEVLKLLSAAVCREWGQKFGREISLTSSSTSRSLAHRSPDGQLGSVTHLPNPPQGAELALGAGRAMKSPSKRPVDRGRPDG